MPSMSNLFMNYININLHIADVRTHKCTPPKTFDKKSYRHITFVETRKFRTANSDINSIYVKIPFSPEEIYIRNRLTAFISDEF